MVTRDVSIGNQVHRVFILLSRYRWRGTNRLLVYLDLNGRFPNHGQVSELMQSRSLSSIRGALAIPSRVSRRHVHIVDLDKTRGL